MIRPEDIAFVNDQAAYHERQSKKLPNDKIRFERHSNLARQFRDISNRMSSELKAHPEQGAFPAPVIGGLRIGNLDDLPKELRDQIKISESDQLEMDIIAVMKGFDGVAAVDEILVGLWRLNGQIKDRDFLARKLYRMSQAGSIHSVPKRKGFYAIGPLPEGSEPDDDDSMSEFQ